MSDLADVRKAVEEAIQLARIGIEECERKMAEVEKIRLELSRYHNEIHKLQGALRALDGKVSITEPIKMTQRRPVNLDISKVEPTKVSTGSPLPITGADFFESLIGNDPLRASQVYALAVTRLELEPDKAQEAALKQRISVYLSALTKKGILISVGKAPNTMYRKNPARGN